MSKKPQKSLPGPDSERMLRMLFEHAREAIGVSVEGRILFVNPAYADLLGFSSPEEMVGLSVFDTVAPTDRELLRERAQRRHAGESEVSVYEFRALRKDGTECDLENYVSLYTLDGQVYTIASTRDVTERNRQARALRESEERLRLAIEAADMGTWEFDFLSGKGHYSESVGPILGYPRGYQNENVQEWRRHIHPDDLPRVQLQFRQALENDVSFEIEHRTIWPDGITSRWVVTKGEIFRNNTGRPVRALGIVQDVTERKRYEEALGNSERLYRTLAETVPDIIFTNRPDGTCDYCSPRWYAYTGQTGEETLGDAWVAVIHPEDRELTRQRWNHSVATGTPFEVEYRLRSRSGAYRWFLGRAQSVTDAEGRILGWAGCCTDIEDQRWREETRQLLAGLGERIRNHAQPMEALEETVRSTCRHLRASRCSYSEIDLPNDRFTVVLSYTQEATKSSDSEEASIRLQGDYRLSDYIPSYVAPMSRGETMVVRDASLDRRTASQFETNFRAIRTRAFIAVPILRRGEWIASLSISTSEGPRDWTRTEIDFMEQIAERMAFAVEHMRLEEGSRTALREREESFALLNTVMAASPAGFAVMDPEFRFLRVNAAFAALNNLTPEEHVGRSMSEMIPAQWPKLREIYRSVLETGTPIYNRENSGSNAAYPEIHRHWLSSYYPIRTSDGKTIGIGLMLVDITERKEHERKIEALNEQLRQSMRETHHRVKNNLQVISALIDMQEMQHTETIPTSELVRLKQHIKSLATVHDVLTRQAQHDISVIDISVKEALEKLMPVVQIMAQERRVVFSVEDVRLPVRQAGALAVLVNELVSNALKHGAGEVIVSFDTEETTARLRVSDQGPGFPEGFDPMRSANTGLDLIQTLATWDMQGTARFLNRNGACAVIEFPLSLEAGGLVPPPGAEREN